MMDRIERWTIVGQITAIIAATAGTRSDPDDFASAKARFDQWLTSPLTRAVDETKDQDQLELEAALGI